MQEVIIQAVQEAVRNASSRGWEAVVLVLVMLGLIGLTGFIVKWLIRSMDKRLEEAKDREDRMAKRLTELETFAQVTLLKVVNDTSAMACKVLGAVDALTAALSSKPCLLEPERQEQFVDRMADRVGEHIIDQRRQEAKT
jgi:hypothetical protein